MKLQPLALLAALPLAWLPARYAFACGVSASGVASCSLAEHEEATRPHWAVGVSGSYTATRLRFSGGVRGSEARYGTQVSLAYLPSSRLVLQAGVGATFEGELVIGPERYEFATGPLLALAADYRVLDAGPVFVLATSALSFSATRTRLADAPPVHYRAFDLRLGGQIGVAVARILRPYALVRVFGGPVYWRYQGAAVTGTDTHHYQLGAGLGLLLTKTFSASVEGVPLGERAFSLGASAAF